MQPSYQKAALPICVITRVGISQWMVTSACNIYGHLTTWGGRICNLRSAGHSQFNAGRKSQDTVPLDLGALCKPTKCEPDEPSDSLLRKEMGAQIRAQHCDGCLLLSPIGHLSRFLTSELTPDENTPVADENETIPDQTKLDPIQDVDVISEESKTNESFPAEATETLVPTPPENDLGSKIVDPGSGESTGPTPEGLVEDDGRLSTSLEKGMDLLPAGAMEVIELSPAGSPAPPAEGIGSLLRVPAEDIGLLHVGPMEGNLSPVIEITKEVQINEEDQLIEGETGEKVETEMHSEIVSEGNETKEEETGEALDVTAATEIEATNNEE
ncbi:glutamate-rich protein 5 isoform X2 [Alligator sinensis]|uniref:Glutamate-rich protein 5 isoform X2 n=1 Tax=Alligator sinensis TaxID=38654 RepID=A0A3Q0H3Y1_ALLSI|nr:glutamate-rich protein 5 isoform X2 [Alligator sinensis]